MNEISTGAMEKMTAGDGTEVFVWGAHLETGIASLDQQHRKLVELINSLSHILLEEHSLAAMSQALLDILAELRNYVQYHFGFETRLMREAQLQQAVIASHIEAHKKEHGEFIERVSEALAAAQSHPLEVIAEMLPFLSRWLLDHIIGMDINMAEHIHAAPAAPAPGRVHDGTAGTVEGGDIFMTAIGRVYKALVAQAGGAAVAGRGGHFGKGVQRAVRELNSSLLSAFRNLRESRSHFENLSSDYAAILELIPGSVFTWYMRPDRTRGFEYANEAFCALLDVDKDALRDDFRLALSAVHRRDMHSLALQSAHAMRLSRPFAWEGRITVDGAARWISVQVNPLARQGGASKWVGLVTDITSHKQHGKANHERHAMPPNLPFAPGTPADATGDASRQEACATCTASRSGVAEAPPGGVAAYDQDDETRQALAEALRRDQFGIVLQPQIDRFHRIVGAEVLLRWQHPERGMLSPATFIPALEATGLIVPVGAHVLDMACCQIAKWSESKALRHLTLSVNVSARQFHDEGFAAQLQHVLARRGINPRCLKLELTESLLLQDSESVIAGMKEMRRLGVQLSLDDFGTGYSSLQYLRRLPLDQIKVDRSFVRNIASDNGDLAILHSIIELADSLGLDVIAEGVETEAQKRLLSHAGCTFFQGYLFGRPMPLEQFEASVHGSAA